MNILKNAVKLIGHRYSYGYSYGYGYGYDVVPEDIVGFDYPATTKMMINVAARHKYINIFFVSVFVVSCTYLQIDSIKTKREKKKNAILDISKEEDI